MEMNTQKREGFNEGDFSFFVDRIDPALVTQGMGVHNWPDPEKYLMYREWKEQMALTLTDEAFDLAYSLIADDSEIKTFLESRRGRKINGVLYKGNTKTGEKRLSRRILVYFLERCKGIPKRKANKIVAEVVLFASSCRSLDD
uniref:Uncharacterized protein n=1 Tax=viral metagenome TaxID=1070528 RepID=A0A6M3IJ45_9ZZZZ